MYYVSPFFATVVCICLYLYESVLMLMVGLLLVLVLLIYNPTILFELLCVITVIYVLDFSLIAKSLSNLSLEPISTKQYFKYSRV